MCELDGQVEKFQGKLKEAQSDAKVPYETNTARVTKPVAQKHKQNLMNFKMRVGMVLMALNTKTWIYIIMNKE